jgi:SOS-response transcriptional repressor LexA
MPLFSLGYLLTVPAGASGEASVYTVEAARVLRNLKLTACFPPGQKFNLKVRVRVGLKQVLPSQGWLCGDGHAVAVESSESASSGERVIVEYRNDDAASPQSCLILVQGELE